MVIGAAFVLKRKADSLQAKDQPQQENFGTPSETPPPDNRAAKNGVSIPAPVLPSELPKPTASPGLTVENRKLPKDAGSANGSLVLNDGRGTISIDRAGRVSGLDEIPEDRRREIVAARIESLPIINQLSPPEATLRGSSSGQPFRLLYPARTVIISDQPLFQWETLAGATAYQVLVGDSNGREVARSEALPPTHTTWMPPGQLQRGEIYSWIVTAKIDGKEVTSPSPSASEMKFQILSSGRLEELNQLKPIRSHLALGIFYASVGLNSEAQHEFRDLVRLNPRSKAARELLRRVAGAQH